MERLGIMVSLTAGYRPQSNGQVERVNQNKGKVFSYFVDFKKDFDSI
jgi:transposase InsO family protein